MKVSSKSLVLNWNICFVNRSSSSVEHWETPSNSSGLSQWFHNWFISCTEWYVVQVEVRHLITDLGYLSHIELTMSSGVSPKRHYAEIVVIKVKNWIFLYVAYIIILNLFMHLSRFLGMNNFIFLLLMTMNLEMKMVV